jgi:hypothetical protein
MTNPFTYQAVAAQYDVTSLVDYVILNSYVVCSADFEQYYVSRYIDLLNTVFTNDYMINLLDSMAAIIAPEMPAHTARWGGTVIKWQSNVQRIRNFITTRNSIIDAGLRECYNLTGPYNIVIDVEPEDVGQVKVNSLELSQFPWDGQYFGGIDVKLQALETSPYYEFDRWVLKNHQVTPSDTLKDVRLSLNMGDSIVALFRPRVFEDSLVINEINYNSANNFDPGDWIEFYNPHEYELDITGWEFKDEDDQHSFVFPAGTVIEPNGYFVICRDTAAFDSLFPDVTHYTGNMDFGLAANGELIRLYDDSGTLIDTVLYDDAAPWPTEPDGNGPTLELINPAWDNALAESWAAAELHGTPGAENGNYVKLPEIRVDESIKCRIYPNPFSTLAIIKVDGEKGLEGASLGVFNLFGQKVKRMDNISSRQIIISREGLPAGIYVYKIFDLQRNGLFTGKFIVN